jgi:hypothetical protein
VFKPSYYAYIKNNVKSEASVVVKRAGYAGKINIIDKWLNKSKSTHFF